jgi:hypothetical protein
MKKKQRYIIRHYKDKKNNVCEKCGSESDYNICDNCWVEIK